MSVCDLTNSRMARATHFLISACVHMLTQQWSAQGPVTFIRVYPFPSPRPPPLAHTFLFPLFCFECRENHAPALKNGALERQRDNACVAGHWLTPQIPSLSLVETTNVNDEDFSSVYAVNVCDQHILANFPLRSSPSTNSAR
jgi:hypothetical protein